MNESMEQRIELEMVPKRTDKYSILPLLRFVRDTKKMTKVMLSAVVVVVFVVVVAVVVTILNFLEGSVVLVDFVGNPEGDELDYNMTE
jgi:hypothetical protein